jgi:hypothetical protein
MPDLQASRTLVKSAPELWAECSDAASLARHLGAFGEIRITKLEPETAVAWEGDEVRGTVALEPSGWGTRVTLTAVAEVSETAEDAPAEAVPKAATEAVREDAPAPVEVAEPRRGGLFSRIFGSRGDPAPAPDPAPPASAPAPGPAAPAIGPAAAISPERALDQALESLGAAHRRPYSRG